MHPTTDSSTATDTDTIRTSAQYVECVQNRDSLVSNSITHCVFLLVAFFLSFFFFTFCFLPLVSTRCDAGTNWKWNTTTIYTHIWLRRIAVPKQWLDWNTLRHEIQFTDTHSVPTELKQFCCYFYSRFNGRVSVICVLYTRIPKKTKLMLKPNNFVRYHVGNDNKHTKKWEVNKIDL